MKITVTTPEHDIHIGLPTGLIFNRGSAVLAQHMAKQISPEVNLPDGALQILCAELRRIKKQYGTWTLVEVESASGAYVKITL